jgi:ABC-type Fe3+-hydroxamate transport system substrate-binding protein
MNYLRLIGFVVLSVVLAACSSVQTPEESLESLATVTYTFETPALGTVYNVGDSVVLPGSTMRFLPFQWLNGMWTNMGAADINGLPLEARGTGVQELHINNINVQFVPNQPLTGARFRFGWYGGNNNLNINGVHRNLATILNANGMVIGGVLVSIILDPVQPAGGRVGTLRMVPLAGNTIQNFYVGGQEFFIDNVSLTN